MMITLVLFLFSFTYPSTTEIYTLSLHDALPIYRVFRGFCVEIKQLQIKNEHEIKNLTLNNNHTINPRSEEHTSELQSLRHLVCRLLLEKKNFISPHGSGTRKGDRVELSAIAELL